MFHKYNSIAIAILLSSSAALHAGSMGQAPLPNKFLLIEGGVSYLHAYYKDSATGADSFSVAAPAGRSYNPSRIYPNDFMGGYMGVSFLMNDWMWNARYELYESKTKVLGANVLNTTLVPAKLAFTLDKMWHTNSNYSMGLGAGVVASTHNKAELLDFDTTRDEVRFGKSFPGRVRLDPAVEVVGMYRLSENFNLKGNVRYQIPAHSFYTNGHLDVGLGINYAVPI